MLSESSSSDIETSSESFNIESQEFENNLKLLNQQQREIYDLFVNDNIKGLFLTGSAGTGKSFVLKLIIKGLERQGLEVAITAPTGVAAFNINGTTIHSWASYPISNFEIKKVIENISRSTKKRDNWLNTDILIIDEISMVSAEMLDHLNEMAKGIRRSHEPFGGIRVLFCGDFFQLPPVAKNAPQPRLAFESSCWKECIVKECCLNIIVRQNEAAFASMLNSFREGVTDSKSLALMDSIVKRSVNEMQTQIDQKVLDALADGKRVSIEKLFTPTKLRPTKNEVELINTRHLNSLPGNVVVINSLDWTEKGSVPSALSDGLYPQMLRLKLNAQVMILKNINISQGVVNGTCGIVRGISFNEKAIGDDKTLIVPEDVTKVSVDVELLSSSRIITITSDVHNVEVNNKVVASRTQIPLELAYAVTIHKCQGQTLDKVDVDLSRTFEVGQAYVALSRAKSMDGLIVRGWDAKKISANSAVGSFYKKISTVDDDDIEEIVDIATKQKPPMLIAPKPILKTESIPVVGFVPIVENDYIEGLKSFLGLV